MSTFKFTKKYLAYPSYSGQIAEWLEKVPSNWKLKKFGSVFAFMSEKVNDTDYEPLSVTYNGVKKQVETAAKTDNGENRKLVKKGDIAINSRSDRKGAAGMAEVDGSMSVIYHDLRSRSKENHTKYFHHLFRSHAFSEEFYRWGRGIVDDLWTTRSNEAKNIQIPVPPVHEQENISIFLDNKLALIDQILTKRQKLIDLLQEKRSTLITHAVTKGLDPNVKMKASGIDWIGDIAENWEIKRIKTLCKILRGASPRPIDDPKYFDENGEYAWVRIADITASSRYLEKTLQRLSMVGKDSSVPLRPGELFLSIAGSVGKPIITKIKCCIHDGFVYFKDLKVNKELLWYIFIAGEAYKGLGKLGTQLNLNTDTVGNISIPVPPKEAQQDIVNFLDNTILKYDQSIHLIENQIIQLTEYRSSLIYHVVTGKIKVEQYAK